MNELYEKLETSDGQKIIYRMAKSRDKATKDLTHVKQIKDRNGSFVKGRMYKSKMEGIF